MKFFRPPAKRKPPTLNKRFNSCEEEINKRDSENAESVDNEDDQDVQEIEQPEFGGVECPGLESGRGRHPKSPIKFSQM